MRSLARLLGSWARWLVGGSERRRPEQPLLADLAPAFARELEQLLARQEQRRLAASVPTLRVVELCSCSKPNCSTFYVIPRFIVAWRWPGGGKTLALDAGEGTVSVDVVEDKIALVEVLDRPDVGAALSGIDAGGGR